MEIEIPIASRPRQQQQQQQQQQQRDNCSGVGMISTLAGVVVFLAFLLLAINYSLVAIQRSRARAVAIDTARRAASYSNNDGSNDSYEHDSLEQRASELLRTDKREVSTHIQRTPNSVIVTVTLAKPKATIFSKYLGTSRPIVEHSTAQLELPSSIESRQITP